MSSTENEFISLPTFDFIAIPKLDFEYNFHIASDSYSLKCQQLKKGYLFEIVKNFSLSLIFRLFFPDIMKIIPFN